MSRRFVDRHPRRLLRSRLVPLRPDHGLDLALTSVRVPPEAESAQRADALAEENALLVRELGRVQARCTQWRDDCIAQAERLEATLMRERAKVIVKVTELAVLREAPDASQERGGVHSACGPGFASSR